MLKIRFYVTRVIVLACLCWLPQSIADTGWKVLSDNIHKGERDTRQYRAITLDNGMKVVLVSDPLASKSLAALALPIGSLDDPNDQLGLAHYLEHMVLMGSKRYPDADGLSQFLKKHGGSHNASTASYRTAFYLEVENDALEAAVDRLADAIAEPLLDPINADRERNAVNAEMTMARTNDGLRMAQVSAETLNPAHPAARFSGGNLDTLKDKPDSVLQTSLLQFYQRYYSSNLLVGVIYSKQPISELTRMAVETYGRIPDRQATVPNIQVPSATEEQKGVIIHYVPAQPKKVLRLEFRIPNNLEAFRSKTDTYIAYLIGNRSANTLSDWLQKQGLIESISAGADPMVNRNDGMFIISVDLTDKGLAQRDEVIAAIFSYLQLLSEKGINTEYFKEIAHVLNLDFNYPSITRDMNYIEGLVDEMLRVPVEHLLDASYLADRYDANAIAERLKMLTPQQARIWFIDSNEPNDKKAYFVDAPYQVDKITASQLALWQEKQQAIHLSLPRLNPYIPDDFSLIADKADEGQPQVIVNQPGLRAVYSPSRYFADEPKANITLALRNSSAQTDVRSQVLLVLTDYLAGLSLDELNYQASVGGIEFSTSASNGLVFNASGFTQWLPRLLNSALHTYQTFEVTAEQLAQAKSWYREQLDSADKVKAFELALQPVQAISRIPYYERTERRQTLEGIQVADIVNYRTTLLEKAAPDLLVVGNMSKAQVITLAEQLKSSLKSDEKSFWYGKDAQIKQKQLATLQRTGSSSDSALVAFYVPTGYGEIESIAYSSLLEKIIHPIFFQQLRTEEQLGYAVFATATGVGHQWGLAFILQSNSKDPDYLYQRYRAFYPLAAKRLQQLSEEEFTQYKQSLINELNERPQTLGEETGRLMSDFKRGNMAFDSKSRLIEQLEKLQRKQLAIFFDRAVLQPQGMALLSQVVGKDSQAANFAKPKGWKLYPTTSALQKTLPVEVHQ